MKIYTKSGDTGETSLYGGGRLPKDALRFEAIGNVDELNAQLGLARVELSTLGPPTSQVDTLLGQIQNHLFDLGAELATPHPEQKGTALLGSHYITLLEQAIDHHQEQLPPLREFILPGGSGVAAQLHVARCICRRAERTVVTLAREATLRPEGLAYLNRLSDLLFVLARWGNRVAGQQDIPWQPGKPRG